MLDVACLAFAGWAQLARSSARYRRRQPPFWSAGGEAGRWAGAALLLLSAAAAVWRLGGGMGVVAWFGLASVSGILLVLLLSIWPQWAVRAAPVIGVAGLAWAIFGS